LRMRRFSMTAMHAVLSCPKERVIACEGISPYIRSETHLRYQLVLVGPAARALAASLPPVDRNSRASAVLVHVENAIARGGEPPSSCVRARIIRAVVAGWSVLEAHHQLGSRGVRGYVPNSYSLRGIAPSCRTCGVVNHWRHREGLCLRRFDNKMPKAAACL
jgi:hypothetical protein